MGVLSEVVGCILSYLYFALGFLAAMTLIGVLVLGLYFYMLKLVLDAEADERV